MIYYNKKILLAAVGFVLAMAAGAYAEEKSIEEAKARISREQARQSVMQLVKNGRIVDEHFRDRWFKDDDYEFIIVDEVNRYRILVNSKTGVATQAKKRAIYTDYLSESERSRLAADKSVLIAPPDARAIAMKRAPGAVITKMDRFMEHESVTYAIEMSGTPEANDHMEITLDGKTGAILLYEETQYGSR